jgi:hypothetical protein
VEIVEKLRKLEESLGERELGFTSACERASEVPR